MNRHKCNHIIFTEKSTESNLDRELIEILYLIFDYPHKHYTFKHFEI